MILPPPGMTFSTRKALLSNSAGVEFEIHHLNGDGLAGRRSRLGRGELVILERHVHFRRVLGHRRRHWRAKRQRKTRGKDRKLSGRLHHCLRCRRDNAALLRIRLGRRLTTGGAGAPELPNAAKETSQGLLSRKYRITSRGQADNDQESKLERFKLKTFQILSLADRTHAPLEGVGAVFGGRPAGILRSAADVSYGQGGGHP